MIFLAADEARCPRCGSSRILHIFRGLTLIAARCLSCGLESDTEPDPPPQPLALKVAA